MIDSRIALQYGLMSGQHHAAYLGQKPPPGLGEPNETLEQFRKRILSQPSSLGGIDYDAEHAAMEAGSKRMLAKLRAKRAKQEAERRHRN